MADLFSGMGEFGLDKLSSELEVYEKPAEETKTDAETQVKQIQESDYIFDKTMVCPVCDQNFKAKTMKIGRVKLLSMDTDLRPKYQEVDSLKYDAVVSPACGFASLRNFYNTITTGQIRAIKEKVSANFKGINQDLEFYTYDDAIARHKLALVNAIVKNAKSSERAYICLKTAWLLRGKRETLPEDTANLEEEKSKLLQEECAFLEKAHQGFKAAFPKEPFPMCGMDEDTCTYLVAELARRSGEFEDANRWLSIVLTSRTANDRLKEKARTVKELAREGRRD